MDENAFSAVCKLDAATRSRTTIVVPDGLFPSRDPRLLTYLGRLVRHPRIVRETIRTLASLGRTPIFTTTRTLRPVRFSSFDEARSDLHRLVGPEPFTAREQRLFDAYTTQHLTRKVVQSPTGEDRQVWVLGYPLPTIWVFIG